MSTSTAIRRTALAASTAAALAAVLIQTLAGPAASTDGMPRMKMSGPAGPSAGALDVSSPRTTTLTGWADPSSSAVGRQQSSSEDYIQLAPYQTQIGAVVTARSSMEAYLTASLYDVHNTWSRLFKSWNYRQPTVTYVFPGPGETNRACGDDSDDTAMYYCPRYDTITISQEAARKLWLGQRGRASVQGTGDMSVSFLVAHEYGHNIAAELGWEGRASDAAMERVADCFGGVWARDAAGRGILEQGDISEAFQGLALYADNAVHGSAADRQHAFKVGYNGGASTCVNTYLG